MSEPATAYYMYVVRCADGTYYTGYTTDIKRRVQAHNEGKGAKYTRMRLPVTLVAYAQFATQHEALSAEFHFKRLNRAQKEHALARCESEDFAVILADLFPIQPPNTISQ